MWRAFKFDTRSFLDGHGLHVAPILSHMYPASAPLLAPRPDVTRM